MPTFPPSIPALDDPRGIDIQIGDGTARTSMEYGPDKIRRRTSSTPDTYNLTNANYTTAEKTTLVAFYKSTLSQGALSFDMTDPSTGDTETFQFLEPPTITSLGGEVWSVSVSLEMLP